MRKPGDPSLAGVVSSLGKRKGRAVNYFPFDRELVTKFESDHGYLTITGQFITELVNFGINEDGELEDDLVDYVANPKYLRPDFLMRDRLDELHEDAFRHLAQNSWAPHEILYGLRVVRDRLWAYWTEFVESDSYESPNNFFTGSQAKELGPKSYRTWMTCSDPIFPIFSIKERNENWIKGPEWVDKKPKSWLDIYALVSLWSVDESIIYLNSNDVFKANVWQERATILNVFFAYESPGSFVRNGGKGGKNAAKRFDPLKERVKEFAEQLKSTGRWKSVRNTAITIAPEIVENSNKLGLNMSPQQAPLTIRDWLNEMGFNEKI